jgi:hypothetical protein
MTGKRKTPIVPTYRGRPVQGLMSVEKGEEISFVDGVPTGTSPGRTQ